MTRIIKSDKPILDACCGGKMFYFNKHDDRVLFQDIRKVKTILCDGRPFEVSEHSTQKYPEIQGSLQPWTTNTI